VAVLWTSDGALSGGRKVIRCCLRSPRQPPARPQVVGRRGERGGRQRWPHRGRHGLVRSPAGASTVAAAAGGKGAQVLGRRGERGGWQRWPHRGRHGLVRSPAAASTVAAAAGGKGAQVGGRGSEGVSTAAAAASKRAQVGQGERVNRSWWPRGGLSQVYQL